MSWGNPQTLVERTVTNLLLPASFIYELASQIRVQAYNSGWLKQKSFPAAVISIGNITCGGTGKTPVVIDLARQLIASGKRVAVLSRGYKRLSKNPLVVASDGHGQIVDCRQAGDEPYLIARSVPEAVVIVGSRRIETAPVAIEQFGCDTLLLDDGFQHLPIARDLDIVLLDYNDDLVHSRVLPSGRLREPVGALVRADRLVVTKLPVKPDPEKLDNLGKLIARYTPGAQMSLCRMTPKRLLLFGSNGNDNGIISSNNDGNQGIGSEASALRGKRVFAFSGIARPQSFINQLTELGANLVGQRHFADHHWYTPQDLKLLHLESKSAEAEILITTEKDSVKLSHEQATELSLAVLQQELEWLNQAPF